MKKLKIASVAKRDGSVEPFEFAKLRRCLAVAMKGCGYDAVYADALARAVALHLQDWRDAAPASTGYIAGCVKAVLEETGLCDVAGFLDRHRRQRDSKRSRISVIDAASAEKLQRSWAKKLAVEVLVERHGVRASVARILAAEVEQRVLALNYNMISTGLLDEIIRNELMAWGLADSCLAGQSKLLEDSPRPD